MTEGDGAADQRLSGQSDNNDDYAQGFTDAPSPVSALDRKRLMVKPTGDYLADLELGAGLAWQFYREACNSDISVLMGWALVDVMHAYLQVDPEGKRVDNWGIVIGFAREIARMLTAIHPCPIIHPESIRHCPRDAALSAGTPR